MIHFSIKLQDYYYYYYSDLVLINKFIRYAYKKLVHNKHIYVTLLGLDGAGYITHNQF